MSKDDLSVHPETGTSAAGSWQVQQRFRETFGAEAQVYCAPGRVNLIGEHTDYNDGFVMPVAIDAVTYCAVAPRADARLVIHSVNVDETVECDLSQTAPQPQHHWSEYPRGVALKLASAGLNLRGANLLIQSEVPVGAGLSSSAAIEVATAWALLGCFGWDLESAQIARLCQQAESEFVGLRCGIMDQFISVHGKAHHAMLLDCRSLDYRWLSLPASVRLVACNTLVRHELAGSEYNQRRADCEAGVRHLSAALPRITALRDVSPTELSRHGSSMPERVRRRCRHVVNENARTLAAAAALERLDLEEFGRLMKASHASLRDDYEVSCAELDLLVELATPLGGVYGARMMGGGFGGCTINLVEAEAATQFTRLMTAGYRQATGLTPDIYLCAASQGAQRLI
jgi:galactokinase